MRTYLIVLCVFLGLGITACGGKKDPAPGDPPPAPGNKPTAPAATAPSAAPADMAACKVLTKEDARELLGLDPGDGQGSTNPTGDVTCAYKNAKPYAKASILIYANGQFAYDEDVKAKLLGDHPVEIAGIGTKAVRNPENTAIGVLANGKFSYVLAVRSSGTPTAEDAEKVAKAIASRM